MNERIKEFRFKAAEYTNEQKPLGIMKWNEMRDAKFAELIVRECSSIAAKNQAEDMNWDISDIIKEHFGVEQ